jgi:Tfp pilus assembly protein PilP
MKTPMKLTTGILAVAVMAGAAVGQNTDAIDQARSIAKSLQQKQANDTNAALDAAGVKAKPAPGAPAPAVKPAVIPGAKSAQATPQVPTPTANTAPKPAVKPATAPTATKAAAPPAQANPAQANSAQGKTALPINPAGTMVVNGPVYGQGSGGRATQGNPTGNSAQNGAASGRWKNSGNRPAGADQGKWAHRGGAQGGRVRLAGPAAGAVVAANPVVAPPAAPKTATPGAATPALAANASAADASKIGESAKQPKPEDKKWAMNGKRDPFFSPVVQQQGGSGCATGKKCLEIGNINLRGVVKSDAGFIAVVTNNMNKAYFLRENDPVFNGYVVRITGDSVVFQETVQDKLGKPFTREVVKRIFTPAV